jgi:hypothetical protein
MSPLFFSLAGDQTKLVQMSTSTKPTLNGVNIKRSLSSKFRSVKIYRSSRRIYPKSVVFIITFNSKIHHQKSHHILTNSLWHRLDPANSQVDGNGNDTNDPDSLAVVWCKVTEDNGEDDTTKVTTGTGETRNDAVGVGVNVRHEGVVNTVATLEEEGETGDKPEHC